MGQGVLRSLDHALAAMPRWAILVLSLSLGVLVGIADYFLLPDLLILYIVPLFIGAWYGGMRVAVVVGIYAAFAAVIAPVLVSQRLEIDGVAWTTFFVRLIAYTFIGIVLARFRESRRQQQELTSFIVHDLRSPLASAITGLLTLEQTEPDLSPETRELVQLSLVSNQRALDLVNSILDVSKLSHGKMPVTYEQTDIAAMVERVIEALALYAHSVDVGLKHTLHVPSAVLDPALTERVLINLLSNAIKFSPPGSSVDISAHSEGGGIRFAVHDNGPGIPAEYLDSVFDPFEQVKGTKGGTGLGLTFCRLAVRAQGGRIGVSSRQGQGTTFWFAIPAHLPTQTQETEPEVIEEAWGEAYRKKDPAADKTVL